MKLPEFSTPGTDALCREVAKRCNGEIFLAFSRGKDSLCSWLQCKKFFRKIHVFHCASYPGLKHVKDTLDYYEKAMTAIGESPVRIMRLVGEEVPMALARGMYQTLDDIEEIETLDTPDFSKLDIVEQLRHDFSLPRAWCVFGISMFDSIDRRIYITKTQGRNIRNLSFYPCYDWPRAEIIRAVRESGIRLSGEYRWTSRTLGGVPSMTVNRIMRDHYPEDWERIQAIYPLAWAKTLRERYLDVAWERRKENGICEDDSAEEIDAEESAADSMPEFA